MDKQISKEELLEKFELSIKGLAKTETLIEWLHKYPKLEKEFGKIWYRIWGYQDESNRNRWNHAVREAREELL